MELGTAIKLGRHLAERRPGLKERPICKWKKKKKGEILGRGKLIDWKKESKFLSKPAAIKCHHPSLEEDRGCVDANITAEPGKH